jgi:hypothetical protein
MIGYQVGNIVFLLALLPGMVIPEMTAYIRRDSTDAG